MMWHVRWRQCCVLAAVDGGHTQILATHGCCGVQTVSGSGSINSSMTFALHGWLQTGALGSWRFRCGGWSRCGG
jgi:hypothetical protein